MDDELVLLTSYFNLVDGRRQDEADTFRVDTNLQSASSPDGSAALYIVTESSTGGHIGPRARRLAADTVAWEYASHGEDPPVARLKAALHVAHEELRREFEGHVAVGVTVMAVERDTVYLAQVAPSQVYVLHEGRLNSIPASMDSGSPFSRALGAEAAPRISVFRDQITHGDVVCLCSTWFDRAADADDLRQCFSAGTSDEIAESLLDLGQEHGVRDATSIVVEATLSRELEVVPTGDDPPGFMQQVDIAVQSLANVGRMLLRELRPPPNGDASSDRVEPPLETVRTPAGAAVPATPAASADVSSATSEVPLVSVDTRDDAPAPEPRSDDGPLPEPTSGTDEGDADFERTEVLAPRVDLPETDDEVPYPAPDRPAGDGSGARPVREDMTEELPRVPPRRPENDRPLTGREPDAPPAGVAPGETVARETVRRDTSLRGTARRPDVRSTEVERPSVDDRGAADSHKREDIGPTPRSELDRVNERLHESQDMSDVIPPVQAFEDTGVEPARIYATSKDIEAANKRPRRFGGAGSVPVIRPGLTDIDLRQPVSRSTPPAVVWASLAVLLGALALGLGYFVKHHLPHTPHTNPYMALVKKDLAQARAASSPAQQDYYLGRARKNLALAKENGAPKTWVTSTTLAIGTTSDSLHHFTRETAPVLITDFTKFPGSQPSEIATVPGAVYVVDPKRKSAFTVAAKTNASPTAMVKAGETYSGFTVGTPVHIAADGNTGLVLDDQNQLFRDSGGTKTATALEQITQSKPHYVAMTTSDPDVYLLDTAASQVWRYPGAVSGYNPTQAAFWDSNPPKLSNAVSFAFDKTSLYILRSDGSVLKFDLLQATPQKFSLNLGTPLNQPVALYTDSNQKWIWIADPNNKRIIQVDKDGIYSRTYLSSSSLDLSKTQSIAVSPDGKTLFVLAGSRLYDFPVVD